MNIIIIVLIFCIVLFIYLHIFYHLKTSDDLEVYEISNISKQRLEEICDLRQPISFNFDIEKLNSLKRENISKTYGSFDIKLRNTLNIYDTKSNSELLVPISLKNGIKVLEEDSESKFISESNADLLEETSLIKVFQSGDEFIRPPMMSSYLYDYLCGSTQSITPFRYDMNYRNYYIVLEGSIKVKMSPPKSSKYLYPKKDYENFEFSSPINPWNVQEEYTSDFEKIKCMEVSLNPGQILFIPSYWWYSIKFENNKSTIISLKYRTYMNTIAILPSIFISFLQKQNIKHEIVGKISKTE